MSNNKFLADYAYLAEASYTDFSRTESDKQTDLDKLKDSENDNKPNSFATLARRLG